MARVPPPADFASAVLEIASIDPGKSFGRIHRKTQPDPLSFGKHATRFSDPRRRIPGNRFGVLYLGETLKVCFVETILRDRRDGTVGEIDLEESELTDRNYSEIQVRAPLRLIDLRDDRLVRMGIPTDVARGTHQALARRWSLAIFNHPAAVDGIVYPSRLINQTNLAIYDRAIAKLTPQKTVGLDRAPGIGRVLDDYKVALT